MTDAQQRPGVREEFRPMTDREREILEMLLSVEAEGMNDLRAQVPHVQVARWGCGCASFDVKVDRDGAPRSSITARPAVEAKPQRCVAPTRRRSRHARDSPVAQIIRLSAS
jgi:hypothetical protein